MTRKITYIVVLLLFTLKLNAQSFSPFVYPMERTKSWNGIEILENSIYFNIEGSSANFIGLNRTVWVSKDLKQGIVAQVLGNSYSAGVLKFNNQIVCFSNVDYSKNSVNGQFSVINKNGKISGPNLIGDTHNMVHSINKFDSTILLTGYYSPSTAQYGLSGFLARYRTNGEKVWEKYVRLNRNGFNITLFDYVYQTKNNEILVIGRSFKTTPPGYRETQIITALFDSSGNLLEVKGELDSLGFRYDGIFRAYRLPRLNTVTGNQLNDSTFCMMVYDIDGYDQFPCTWIFFNEKGNVISHRKAWLYRDTISNPFAADIYFKNLVPKKDGNGFLAQVLFPDSFDRHRVVSLDNDLYITKVYNGVKEYSTKNISAGLFAFTEDLDGSIFQLRSLSVDSITTTDVYGSLVCKVDSNGNLLSNGPIFPVGMSENLNTLGVKLFPNPTKDKINIVIPNSTHLKLEIYNLNGNLIETQELQQSITYTSSNLLSGLYWFRFSDSSGNTHTEKIWVK